MDVDLNIDNYSFDDLLKLFNLSYTFTTEELKNAKKIVLKTHPDKSKLPKEYFLFFSKAYKVIVHINDFRNKTSKKGDGGEYSKIIDEEETDKQNIVSKLKNKKQFNKFFNEMFEKMKNKSEEEESGYEEWLKQDNNSDVSAKNINSLHSNFEKLKAEKRELVVYNGIEDIVDNISSGSQNLSGETPTSYTNNSMFDKNNYIDVKEAYDNPVVPVTTQDYKNKKQYSSVDELQRERTSMKTYSKDILDKQAKIYFSNKKNIDDEQGSKTAFKLIQQEQVSRKNNELFWGHLKLLENHK
jgi:hypothetical protein